MTNKDIEQLINKYLNGETTPAEECQLARELQRTDIPEEWQAIRLMLGELTLGEAEYDALLAERTAPFRLPRGGEKKSLPSGRLGGGRWLLGIAASVLLLLVFRVSQDPEEQQPVVAEVVEPEVVEQKPSQPAPEPAEISESPEIPEPNKANKPNKVHRPNKPQQQLAAASETSATDSTPRLTTTADSLYYYLTQLENQMGDCRDSTCLAELGNLMRANEHIKGLVNKILHKEIETAFQEEYLVDTTIHYIPL